ncbi:6577_t:CDS:2 [Diversispora eburnea]|uniref:6577_t:CDS:1 n=1 Tax=Diversispora eburnea TaxID=1213867 RepID=A0A9N8YTU6_9GLOM|nr:6577_t:CDS:2 [Diversispora eburnea]
MSNFNFEIPKNNNPVWPIIMETGEKTNGEEAKKIKQLIRSANANQDVVPLYQVPFPPELKAEDLIGLSNNSKEKRKAPNQFFIYRKWYTICNANKGNAQTAISPYISIQWKKEPPHVKAYYKKLAVKASRLFKSIYGEVGICIKNSTNVKKSKVKKNNKIQNQKSPKIQPKNKNEDEHKKFDSTTQALLISTNSIPPNSTPIAPCLSLNPEAASYPSPSPESYVSYLSPESSSVSYLSPPPESSSASYLSTEPSSASYLSPESSHLSPESLYVQFEPSSHPESLSPRSLYVQSEPSSYSESSYPESSYPESSYPESSYSESSYPESSYSESSYLESSYLEPSYQESSYLYTPQQYETYNHMSNTNHLNSIQNALKVLASPEHPSVRATARIFGIAEATLSRLVRSTCANDHSSNNLRAFKRCSPGLLTGAPTGSVISGKGCDELYSSSVELATNAHFLRYLDKKLKQLLTPTYKATEIWPFNSDAISSDRFDSSLVTERLELPSEIDDISPEIDEVPPETDEASPEIDDVLPEISNQPIYILLELALLGR